MMSASTGRSISLTYTGAPVSRATGATAPTWSKCGCGRSDAATARPSSRTGARIRSGSSPGSKMTARVESSRRAMKQFSWTGPTVNMRTSMTGEFIEDARESPPAGSAAFLALSLPAPVDKRVHQMEGGDIEGRRQQGQPDRLPRGGSEQQRGEQEEARRREQPAHERAAPGGWLVQPVLAPLLRAATRLRARAR